MANQRELYKLLIKFGYRAKERGNIEEDQIDDFVDILFDLDKEELEEKVEKMEED